MKLKIKKGATVEVITGADKGKRGKVLAVEPSAKRIRIKVSGVKMMTHYSKQDGLKKMEGFIDYSNVKLIEAAAATEKKTTKKKTKSAKA